MYLICVSKQLICMNQLVCNVYGKSEVLSLQYTNFTSSNIIHPWKMIVLNKRIAVNVNVTTKKNAIMFSMK